MAYTALITDFGMNKIATASGVEGLALSISHVALGDAAGAAYEPDFDQTTLRGERIRRPIDNRAQIETKTWLTRTVFPADDVPEMEVREQGFFDGDNLAVIVAGAAFQPRSLGGFDYILEQPLNFDRAAEGAVIVNAPDWELFDHAVINLSTQAIQGLNQFDLRLRMLNPLAAFA